MMRVLFVGIDNPHGAGWRDLTLNLSGELEVVGFVPGYGGSIFSLEERFAHLPRYETVSAALQELDFDGAIVCLPNDSGPAAITELAKQGKHVLAEKPIAGSPGDMDAVVKAVKKNGVSFQSGYMWRYDEAANRLKAMCADGRFGDLISVEMLFVTSDVTRRGPTHYLFDPAISKGGFFNWLACHYLDLLMYVTGEKITSVQATVGSYSRSDNRVEDGGMVIMQLASGALASFSGGYWVPRWAGEAGWTIRGTERWVRWDPGHPDSGGLLEIHGPQPQWYKMDEDFVVPKDDTPGYGGASALALVRDWIYNAKRGGACRNTATSARETLRLIDAIYESSKTGKRIECEIG